MIIDNSIVKELCPYCKGDISNMTYRDSIRRENARGIRSIKYI